MICLLIFLQKHWSLHACPWVYLKQYISFLSDRFAYYLVIDDELNKISIFKNRVIMAKIMWTDESWVTIVMTKI